MYQMDSSFSQMGNPQIDEEGLQYVTTECLNTYEEINCSGIVSFLDIQPLLERELGDFIVQ